MNVKSLFGLLLSSCLLLFTGPAAALLPLRWLNFKFQSCKQGTCITHGSALYSKPKKRGSSNQRATRENFNGKYVDELSKQQDQSSKRQSPGSAQKSILGETIISCRPFAVDGKKEFQFLGSFTELEKIPESSLPEVAFIGKSNTGKSSLINCLTKRKKNIAVQSKTPGRTQCMNLFRCFDKTGDICIFVDLPGYGYAKISKSQQEDISKFIRDYLKRRGALKLVVMLVDARREIQQQDLQMAEFLESEGLSCVMVATKVDKVKKSELDSCAKRLVDGFSMQGSGIIPFSAVTGQGQKDVWKAIQAGLLTAEEDDESDEEDEYFDEE